MVIVLECPVDDCYWMTNLWFSYARYSRRLSLIKYCQSFKSCLMTGVDSNLYLTISFVNYSKYRRLWGEKNTVVKGANAVNPLTRRQNVRLISIKCIFKRQLHCGSNGAISP